MNFKPRPTTIYREEYRGEMNATRETRDPEQFAQWRRNWDQYRAEGSSYLGQTVAAFYKGNIDWHEIQ